MTATPRDGDAAAPATASAGIAAAQSSDLAATRALRRTVAGVIADGGGSVAMGAAAATADTTALPIAAPGTRPGAGG